MIQYIATIYTRYYHRIHRDVHSSQYIYIYIYIYIYVHSSCTCIHTLASYATNSITLRILYTVIMWWGKILVNLMNRQPFTNVLPIDSFSTLIYSIGAYFHNFTLERVLVLSDCLSFKISLSHLPVVDSVIASIKIVAITGQPLSCFYLPYVLIARCGSLIYSKFKHTHYYTLSSITHV